LIFSSPVLLPLAKEAGTAVDVFPTTDDSDAPLPTSSEVSAVSVMLIVLEIK
jgi:hypothetical protein